MPYCPSCDTTTAERAYCPECGSELIQPESEPTATPESGGEATTPGRDVTPTPTPDETDYFRKGPISFTFTYPVGDGWKPIIISAAMILFSWLIIPYFIVYGYAYRLGRGTIRGDARPPAFDDWGGLLKDGLLAFVVSIPYFIAVLIFVGIPLALAILMESIVLGVIAVLFYIVAIYIGAGILPTFMATGSVVGTYSGLRFLEFVKTMSYLKALVLIFVTSLLASLVIGITAIILTITIVGILLLFPLYLVAAPFLMFIPFLLFGYYYREAVGLETVSPMDDPDTIGASM